MSEMIPEGWIKASLSEVVAVNPKHTDLEDQVAGFVPMALAPTDFNGTLNYEERQWNDIKKGYTHFATGDIIFAKVTPCFENGKAAIVKDMPNGIGAGSTEFYVLRPLLDSISSDYIFSVIKSYEFLQTGAENMTGAVGLRRVPKKFVEDFKINLPPLAEQKVIADKLDELLAQVESTKARLDAIPAILKSFRQSVLAAAVSGKLTEEWRGKCAYTPTSISLDEIKLSRINRLGKKSPSKTHLLSEEYIIPESWQWVSLDFLSLKIVDGTHHTPTYIDAGIPFISVKDIKNGQINFESTKFISEEEHDTLSKRCKPDIGDLLITKSGTIGRTAIVKQCIEFSLFVSVALIKPVSSMVNMQFIDIALQKWVNEIDVSSRIVGTAIKNLHLQDMKVLAIPFAPIEEQTEIIRRVEELFAFADKVEAQVNAAQARVNNLTQSILAKAFRGELTADWRAANPELICGENSASALLKRIKAEREALSVKTKPAKKAKA